jgi:hypothetical protein
MANEHAGRRMFNISSVWLETAEEASGGEMMMTFYRSAAVFAAAWATLVSAGEVQATVFAAWQVAHVPDEDTLNVRKYPSGTSQKQAAYPNGTVLQMTGRCTGGINLLDISSQPAWKQEQKIRYRWCEVWHDPAHNGSFVTGWIYGKYIEPY